MNFFHSLFKSKLDAMRAAAPRATIHALHESNGFSIYLDEATAACRVTQLGTLTDHAEDVLLDDPVPVLFVPLEQAVRFVEEVTASHSVALVDVILADKVHAARYVMYAYFAKKASVTEPYDRVLWEGLAEHKAKQSRQSSLVEDKESEEADFWG